MNDYLKIVAITWIINGEGFESLTANIRIWVRILDSYFLDVTKHIQPREFAPTFMQEESADGEAAKTELGSKREAAKIATVA